jgi:hypothetical protein
MHLELAKFWDNTWHVIKKYINYKLELEMQNKYKTIYNKLKKFPVKTNNNKCV